MTREEEAIEILSLARFTGSSASELDAISDALDVAIEALKEQRPHGEWIEKTGMRPPEDKGVKFCSNCMIRQPRDFITHKPIEPNFRPNCGASMKEGEAE